MNYNTYTFVQQITFVFEIMAAFLFFTNRFCFALLRDGEPCEQTA